jgi:hypothetical protein
VRILLGDEPASQASTAGATVCPPKARPRGRLWPRSGGYPVERGGEILVAPLTRPRSAAETRSSGGGCVGFVRTSGWGQRCIDAQAVRTVDSSRAVTRDGRAASRRSSP